MKLGYILSFFGFLLFLSCQSPSQGGADQENELNNDSLQPPNIKGYSSSINSKQEVIEKEGIRLIPIQEESNFPNAKLQLAEHRDNEYAVGKNRFEFEVEGFELGEQTADERAKRIANSSKGQHIHFILNNGPYSAHYEPTFESDLLEGNNVILAFLSRSYHESVKNPNAFVFKHIGIGEFASPFDHTAPHLFYSRPKGKYSAESEQILLDFFLLNAELKEGGMQVRATIDGVVFTLHAWQAYLVEGLDKGEHTFRLQLIDHNGELIDGPFNDSGLRTIMLVD